MLKAVLDTNVLLSAVIVPQGNPAQILEQSNRFNLVTSEAILAELADVLHYPHIQRWYKDKISERLIGAYFTKLRQIGTVIDVRSKVAVVQADPKDDIIIACALDGDADYIISGDRHLLDLNRYESIQITSPGMFLQVLREQS